MKIKVLIDTTRSPRTGIGIYSWNMLEYLNNHYRQIEFVGLTFSTNKTYAQEKNLKTIEIPHNPTNADEVKTLSQIIEKQADLYIATNFSQIVFPRIPIIQVVHDLIYMRNESWQPTKNDLDIRHGDEMMLYINNVYLPLLKKYTDTYGGNWRQYIGKSKVSELYTYSQSHSIIRASALIAVSQQTKRIIHDHYCIEHPIHVIYPIINRMICEHKKEITTENEIVFLYIANFEPRKNHNLLFSALSKLPYEFKVRSKLILIGNVLFESHFNAIKKELANTMADFQVEIYNNISEEQKWLIMEYSSLLLYPSVDEGFGIPLLEAMNCNLPIIAFNIPIIKEVCGSGAYLVSEVSSKAFSEAILKVMSELPLQDSLKRNQVKQLKKFSFKNIYIEMDKIFSYVMKFNKQEKTLKI